MFHYFTDGLVTKLLTIIVLLVFKSSQQLIIHKEFVDLHTSKTYQSYHIYHVYDYRPLIQINSNTIHIENGDVLTKKK